MECALVFLTQTAVSILPVFAAKFLFVCDERCPKKYIDHSAIWQEATLMLRSALFGGRLLFISADDFFRLPSDRSTYC